jgi:hypothetical protein
VPAGGPWTLVVSPIEKQQTFGQQASRATRCLRVTKNSAALRQPCTRPQDAASRPKQAIAARRGSDPAQMRQAIAAAKALAEVPQFNGFHENGAHRAGPGIHVGWAIALATASKWAFI